MCRLSFMYSERIPFISQGDAYMAVGTPTGGPNDVVQDNVLFIIMASQAKEISLPGFPYLLLESPVQHVQALSCRNSSRRS